MTRSEPVDRRILPKDQLCSFLAAMQETYRVVAPQRVGPEIVYDDFHAERGVELDFVNTVLPPKAFFFSRRERLFSIKGTRPPTLVGPPEQRPLALFGLRSCDATGIVFLESFFGQRGFDDGTVTGPISRSLRMTLACNRPGPDCFCVCCEGGPFLTSGFDLQFVDLGGIFLVEVGTPRGLEAIQAGTALFAPAAEAHLAEKQRLLEQVDGLFERRTYIARGIKDVTLGRIPEQTWEDLAASCQGCGGCCHVCPTCSCFTVNDIASGDGDGNFHRERSWDACLYRGFTHEASGHNPRAKPGQRLGRRFFHKLSYHYVERMNRHGCVGCGRCVTTCMGGLDISTLVERFNHAAR